MGSSFETLVSALIDGDRERSLALVGELIDQGRQPLEIVTEGIETAMSSLDRKCTAEQFNLLEIMLAGRAVIAVIHQLFPGDIELPNPCASVVTAVLEGDIHDIGKSILKILLAGSRIRIVDCGKDASIAAVVKATIESKAVAVCISGLISSVIPLVRTVRSALTAAGLGHVKILAGGAALKQCSAETLNVDFVGQTAFDAVHYISGLVENANAPR